jgi:iron complex transport system permease protein
MPALALLVSIVIAALLSMHAIWTRLPISEWLGAIQTPDPFNLQQLVAGYVILPRILTSILAGAALALSGTIFQQMLRNPLAEATTLGVSSGASLALAISTLWLPGLTSGSQETITFVGAALALVLTMALAWRDAASPLRLILAGLVVNLFCGVVSAVLALFYHEQLRGVFLWNSGSLMNMDWATCLYLAPRLILFLILALLFSKPFSLLALEDESAKSLGVSLTSVRLFGMLLAAAIAASVVSAVGSIGFLGIAAPAILRMAGVRTFRGQIIGSPLVGATMLWLADQLTQANPFFNSELPTGTLISVLGGAFMLWMLPRLKSEATSRNVITAPARRLRRPWLLVTGAALTLVLIAWCTLIIGQSAAGWHVSDLAQLQVVLPWRWPRVVAALTAGAMLAMAGTFIQRMTGNAMASPEILGVSAGATLGVILLFFIDPSPGRPLKIGVAGLGAFLTLVAMLSLARRSAFSPERMLLTGVALGTVLGALLAVLTVRADPRLGNLLAWMAGSTYAVTAWDALTACLVTGALISITPLIVRWLEVLPLGVVTARELGVDLASSRLVILLMTAVLTGAAVLIVGPLSFVGLMGPHIARLAGFQRALPHIAASAIIGGLIMVLADWLGRNLLFPYQVPAGILASLVGAPYFMWLMWRRTS